MGLFFVDFEYVLVTADAGTFAQASKECQSAPKTSTPIHSARPARHRSYAGNLLRVYSANKEYDRYANDK